MGKAELRYFLINSHHYNENDFGDDGCVWEHKEIGFNKDQVQVTQLTIDFNPKS
jgi:hypothetical protein